MTISCHMPVKTIDVLHTMLSMPSALQDKYIFNAEQGTGGKSLDFLLRNIVYPPDELAVGPAPDDMFERANRLAASIPPGSDGVLVLPWLSGTIAPEENARARAGILNLSLNSTRGHVVRALMESIAYNNRWTGETAQKWLGRRFDSLRFCGGGALSDLWAQIHADALGLPIRRVADPACAPLRGSALLALSRLGGIPISRLSELIKIDEVFQPDPVRRRVYDAGYAKFRQAYKINKSLFAMLNG